MKYKNILNIFNYLSGIPNVKSRRTSTTIPLAFFNFYKIIYVSCYHEKSHVTTKRFHKDCNDEAIELEAYLLKKIISFDLHTNTSPLDNGLRLKNKDNYLWVFVFVFKIIFLFDRTKLKKNNWRNEPKLVCCRTLLNMMCFIIGKEMFL